MNKIIFITLVTSLLVGCDCKEYEPPGAELPYGTVGKPYYAEITIGGNRQYVDFEQTLTKDGHNRCIEFDNCGFKWEFTDVYRNPNAQITSNSIVIYGTPNRKGWITVNAYSELNHKFFGTQNDRYSKTYSIHIKAEDE